MKKIKLLGLMLLHTMHATIPILPSASSVQGFGKVVQTALVNGVIGGTLCCAGVYYGGKKLYRFIEEQQKEPDFKVYKPGDIKESFDSIAGCSREKQYFQDIVEYLKNPKIYESLGAKPSKGILLTGAPGSGKTMLVRALAGSADCLFIYACGADFNAGSSRIKKIFEQAKAESKLHEKACVIFLDEFELLAPSRDKDHVSSSVITLLTELDGFVKDEEYPVIIIAATNYPEKIDSAILRPGRINRTIQIKNPKTADRKAILLAHLSSVKYEEGLDISSIAQRTSGFTGAGLAEVVQAATRIAANNNQACVTLHNLEEALDVEQLGVLSERKPSQEEKKITAYHEAGHALVNILARPKFKVAKATIVGREKSLGVTQFVQVDENEILDSKEDALNAIAMALGGRAAEEIIFNLMSQGASSDLAMATDLAKSMVREVGMSNSLMVETNNDKMDCKDLALQVNQILDEQYQRSLKLLRGNIGKLHVLAAALQEKETLYSNEIYPLVNKA